MACKVALHDPGEGAELASTVHVRPHLAILGTRGIPAAHGGFETFAEKLALHLVARGWRVTVYCQEAGSRPPYDREWEGVRLVHVPVRGTGAAATIHFDWKAMRHALTEDALVLTLGYNTALFSVAYRLTRRTHLMNMDGMEWQRTKWPVPVRAWFYLNERMGCWLSTHLIADHPDIAAHLATRAPASKISTIPYGADEVHEADAHYLEPHGIQPHEYVLLIARPTPDNSILEIVQAYSHRRRGMPLVVLGDYTPETDAYHRAVLAAAGAEVRFLGPVYEQPVLHALRFFARLYVHGHRVGGTNPSLVEALGSGNAVLAHDNRFNRWVAGDAARYFTTTAHCSDALDTLMGDDAALTTLRRAARARHRAAFQWEDILPQYETLLRDAGARAGATAAHHAGAAAWPEEGICGRAR